MIDRHPIVTAVRLWLIGVCIYFSIWIFRMGGKMSEDTKEFDNVLRAMWDEGIYARKVDGSLFGRH